ncbi:hypothetical protein QBC42DRAFT_275212 [Cladorrhinum samala]|uniref:Uncharacterized protein n=1 Tax=Cladorrhinum samala TaxID=585594 RepID=A0AAV9HFX6_9PEZI|nr:hypothetical protein QBC42DRAFT_275212 [Cladorrhinum samala]
MWRPFFSFFFFFFGKRAQHPVMRSALEDIIDRQSSQGKLIPQKKINKLQDWWDLLSYWTEYFFTFQVILSFWVNNLKHD